MRRKKKGIITKALALREIARRSRERKNVPDLLDANFQAQSDFIRDNKRLKAALCTRRAGKSYGCALYLISEALKNPGTNHLYIALTRDSAKKIAWKDCLKAINNKFRLGIRFNEMLLVATLPNGSQISLMGVDVTEKEKEKILGQKFRLVIIDESASFTIDLRELVYVVLKPAVADLEGTICLIGTPGNITKNLFYDICSGKEPGWSVHKWGASDNPYMKVAWERDLAEIQRDRPLYMQTAQFKQHYLGQWVIDDTKLVYHFDESRNVYRDLPKHPVGEWTYCLGVDLGYNDDAAFVLVAYHTYDHNLYIITASKAPGLDITDTATRIKSYQREFDLSSIIIDGANKQAVAEIQNRHSIALRAADKTGKSDFIALMDDEIIQGKIKLHYIHGRKLRQEWENLIWLEKDRKREEHPSCPNHLADAALYVWRYCYTYYAETYKAPLVKGSPEFYKAEEDAMERDLIERLKREEVQNNFDIFY
jgi:phage terminase large subunit